MRFIVGIYGHSLDKRTTDFISKYQPYGVILFSRNIDHSSEDQLKELVKDILEHSQNTIIFIDQEGGRIQRIKPPLVSKIYPHARIFGDLYRKNKEDAMVAVYDNYYKLTEELVQNYGIRGICAPVCDIFYPNLNTDVIGDRAFSANPYAVTDLAIAAMVGIKDAGGLTCIKHIPGHGRAQVDSHIDLPYVEEDLDVLMDTDFHVFKEIMDRSPNLVDYAMTAHILYKCIDSENPITTSKKGIQFLRNELGAKCMIMSDDLNMKALKGDLNSIYNKVAEAGCDVALICHSKIEELESLIESA